VHNRARSSSFFLTLGCVSLAVVGSGTSFGAQVTLGSADNVSCYPFNCNDSGSATGQSIEYQQVYSSSQFGSSPVTITSITFFDQFFPGLGLSDAPLLSGTYAFSFAVTSAAVGGLSTTLLNNVTSGKATFLVDSNDPGNAGASTLTFNGTTPYVYNPASGNLLLDIVVTNQANVSSASTGFNGFDADDTGTATSRALLITGQSATADNGGLVTQFTLGSSSATPEPGTYALMGCGLLLLMGLKKRKALALQTVKVTSGVALVALLVSASSSSASAQLVKGRYKTAPLHAASGAAKAGRSSGAISESSSTSLGPTTVPIWNKTFTIGSTPYQETFVGSDPSTNNSTTTITVPVIPVIIVLAEGTFDPTKKLNNSLPGMGLTAATATLLSPLFQGATYNLGGTPVGTNVQYGDAQLRATWWNYVSSTSPNWHTVLQFQLKPTITLTVPPAADGGLTGPFGQVDNAWLGAQLDALSQNYGATTFPLFVMYQMFQTDASGCCILGYHSAVLTPGNSVQTYAVGSYYDPGEIGGGTADITALSHEVAEWLNDPFGNNPVPNWPAPFSFIVPGPPYNQPGQPQQCQNNLEVGDPIEDRNFTVFSVTTVGHTYHPQNVALAPWFLQVSPSTAVNGWYTMQGPIDNEFVAPAPACSTAPASIAQ